MIKAAMFVVLAGLTGGSGASAPRDKDANALMIPNYDLSQTGSFRVAYGRCSAASEAAGVRYRCGQALILWRTPTPTGDITVEVWDGRRPASEIAVTGVMDGKELRVRSVFDRARGRRPAAGRCTFVGTMPAGYGPMTFDNLSPPDNRVAAGDDGMTPPDAGFPDNRIEASDVSGDNMIEPASDGGNKVAPLPQIPEDTVTRFACDAAIDGRRVLFFDFTQKG